MASTSPSTNEKTAADRLRARIDAGEERAQYEARAAGSESYRRFWEGRIEALRDVRLWIAQELDTDD